MKRTFKLILSSAILFLTVSGAYANGMNRTLSFTGLGVTADYGHTSEMDDGGCYLSLRSGFVHIVSGFFSADIGYRFNEKSINSRTGFSLMFLFVGFEAGYAMAAETDKDDDSSNFDDGKFAHGVYIGLAGTIPERDFGLFLSIGGKFYFQNHEKELYTGISCLINFAEN